MTREVTLTYTEVRNWLKAQPFNRTFDMRDGGSCLVGQYLADVYPGRRCVSGVTSADVIGLDIRYIFDRHLYRIVSDGYDRSDAMAVPAFSLLFRMPPLAPNRIAEFFHRMWRACYANAG